MGGALSDTEILAWDYQNDGTKARLVMGGRSNSGDVVTHTGSAILIYEDAINYKVLWAKEFYRFDYMG